MHLIDTLAQPAPLQHFSGELVEMTAGCKLDLHALQLKLVDDAGAEHIVFIAHGRGDDAARRCLGQYKILEIGRRYHGSATLHRVGDLHHYWMGAVSLQACLRRPRFELVRRHVASGAPA